MKSVQYAATAIVLGMACTVVAIADPASTSGSAATAPARSTTPISDLGKDLLLPETEYHPEIQSIIPAPNASADASLSATLNANNQEDVPLINPAQHQPTQVEIQAYLKRQSEEEKNKDWLMRGYEKQLQSKQIKSHIGNTTEDQNTDLYYQLTTDKELAKLAGLPALELSTDTSDKGALVLREGSSNSKDGARDDTKNSAKDDATNEAKSKTPDITAFKPLINPNDPVVTNQWSNPYTALSYDAARMTSQSGSTSNSDGLTQGNSAQNGSTAAAPTFKSPDVSMPTAIETPGLVAAQSDPLATSIGADLSSPEFSQDPLPQDHSDHSTSGILSTVSTVPPETDSAMLQKSYAKAFDVPDTFKNTQPQALNPPISQLPDTSEQMVRVVQPNPVRRPIANPLDIPYH